MTDTHTEREREAETQVPCREPNEGLNPRTPGSPQKEIFKSFLVQPSWKLACNCLSLAE